MRNVEYCRTWNIYLWDAQHLHHLNTLIDTIRCIGYIQWTICKHMGLQVTKNYCEHIPEWVINVKSNTITRDIPVTTGKTNSLKMHNISWCAMLCVTLFSIQLCTLTFRHRASSIQGQAFRYSPENAFYIFNQQIYFIIWYLLDGASLI